MERPQPKELVIRYAPPGRLIEISAHSEDARGWIEREAPRFGNFGLFQHNAALLFVNRAYDPAEVAAWLATYNQEPRP